MAYRVFVIPARDDGRAAAEVNGFLRGHRVLSVERRWVEQGENSYWAFCVDYLESGQFSGGGVQRGAGDARGKVDYREVLTPEQFAVFVKLRALRAEISKAEGVPVYVIFTNEQLASMVQGGAASKADLGRIDGVGEARIQKYGERFLECLKQHGMEAHETRGPSDGADSGVGESPSGVLEGGQGETRAK